MANDCVTLNAWIPLCNTSHLMMHYIISVKAAIFIELNVQLAIEYYVSSDDFIHKTKCFTSKVKIEAFYKCHKKDQGSEQDKLQPHLCWGQFLSTSIVT